jgi:hypothetical protein
LPSFPSAGTSRARSVWAPSWRARPRSPTPHLPTNCEPVAPACWGRRRRTIATCSSSGVRRRASTTTCGAPAPVRRGRGGCSGSTCRSGVSTGARVAPSASRHCARTSRPWAFIRPTWHAGEGPLPWSTSCTRGRRSPNSSACCTAGACASGVTGLQCGASCGSSPSSSGTRAPAPRAGGSGGGGMPSCSWADRPPFATSSCPRGCGDTWATTSRTSHSRTPRNGGGTMRSGAPRAGRATCGRSGRPSRSSTVPGSVRSGSRSCASWPGPVRCGIATCAGSPVPCGDSPARLFVKNVTGSARTKRSRHARVRGRGRAVSSSPVRGGPPSRRTGCGGGR